MTEPSAKQFVGAAISWLSGELGPSNIEMTETPAENLVSQGDDGAWVEVWVWVPNDLALAQPPDEDEDE